VLGGSCNTIDGCALIPNSTCNSTCVCVQGFVEGTTNKTCLPVAKDVGSACEEKVQCSKLGTSFGCVDKKCISEENVTTEGDIQEESQNKDKCTDHTCHAANETKSPCTNGNCTTPATTSAERVENIVKPTAAEGRKIVEKKGSGGSSVVQTSFLAAIWVVHLVM